MNEKPLPHKNPGGGAGYCKGMLNKNQSDMHVFFVWPHEAGEGRLKTAGRGGAVVFRAGFCKRKAAVGENTCTDKAKYLKLRVYEIKF